MNWCVLKVHGFSSFVEKKTSLYSLSESSLLPIFEQIRITVHCFKIYLWLFSEKINFIWSSVWSPNCFPSTCCNSFALRGTLDMLFLSLLLHCNCSSILNIFLIRRHVIYSLLPMHCNHCSLASLIYLNAPPPKPLSVPFLINISRILSFWPMQFQSEVNPIILCIQNNS